eukprot:NODE_3687_length_1176_cov_106.249763_g3502_i0.p1 GENE.NODE_3687_length_1176_cov_106.249763_g3502_i0~~NODE_3687_length_1176_cov_106.249763_g3502_i0.p1  ORF type:complete len:386 (-),score=31.69 NODE_3687_length_1176_cov_106.249763_g3502_i0:19-1119(-)
MHVLAITLLCVVFSGPARSGVMNTGVPTFLRRYRQYYVRRTCKKSTGSQFHKNDPSGMAKFHDRRCFVVPDADIFAAQSRAAIEVGDAAICAEIQDKYYLHYFFHGRGTRFRTDQPLQMFYELLRGKWSICESRQRQEEMAVIDVGAHDGQDLDYWITHFGPARGCSAVTIIMFEASPSTRKRLENRVATIKDNQPSLSLTVVGAAAGDVTGEVYFGTHSNSSQVDHIMSAAEANSPPADVSVIKVKCTTLNDYFVSSRFHHFPLLKIDAEGFDALVLRGASDILSRVGAIVFECHSLWATTNSSLNSVIPWLSTYGFQTYQIGMPFSLRLYGPYFSPTINSVRAWSNCFAARKSHPILQHIPTIC